MDTECPLGLALVADRSVGWHTIPMTERLSAMQVDLIDLYTDGGSQPNPGPSAIGLVILTDAGEELESAGLRIGHATNNIAEYRAMIEGLRCCANHTRGRVRCFSDSMLVVQQVTASAR